MAKMGKITVALLWKTYGGNTTSVSDLAVRLDADRFEVIFIFLRTLARSLRRRRDRCRRWIGAACRDIWLDGGRAAAVSYSAQRTEGTLANRAVSFCVITGSHGRR